MLIHYTATIKNVIHLTNLNIKFSTFHKIYVLMFFSSGFNEISVTIIRVGSET